MANGHGGYRQPSNPASVSGPGRYSARTDGQTLATLPNAEYGEQAEYQAIQGGAPMSATPPVEGGGGMPAGAPLPPGFGDPTERPDEPVTSGIPLGAGAGSMALPGPPDVRREDAEALRQYMPALLERANNPKSTPSFRRWVRQIRAELGA